MRSHNLAWGTLHCLRWAKSSIRSKNKQRNVPQEKKLPSEHLSLPDVRIQDKTVQLVLPLSPTPALCLNPGGPYKQFWE